MITPDYLWDVSSALLTDKKKQNKKKSAFA
jgi:hypothetical protein